MRTWHATLTIIASTRSDSMYKSDGGLHGHTAQNGHKQLHKSQSPATTRRRLANHEQNSHANPARTDQPPTIHPSLAGYLTTRADQTHPRTQLGRAPPICNRARTAACRHTRTRRVHTDERCKPKKTTPAVAQFSHASFRFQRASE